MQKGNGVITTANLHVIDCHINIFNDSEPRKYLRRRHTLRIYSNLNEAGENIYRSMQI